MVAPDETAIDRVHPRPHQSEVVPVQNLSLFRELRGEEGGGHGVNHQRCKSRSDRRGDGLGTRDEGAGPNVKSKMGHVRDPERSQRIPVLGVRCIRPKSSSKMVTYAIEDGVSVAVAARDANDAHRGVGGDEEVVLGHETRRV